MTPVTPDLDPFLPPRLVALAVARPANTIWTWARRLRIASACDVATHEVLVRLKDAGDRAALAEVRYARPEHATRRRNRAA